MRWCTINNLLLYLLFEQPGDGFFSAPRLVGRPKSTEWVGGVGGCGAVPSGLRWPWLQPRQRHSQNLWNHQCCCYLWRGEHCHDAADCQVRLRVTSLPVPVRNAGSITRKRVIVQELCESRGGRPGLSVLMSILVSVDVKLYWTMLQHWSQLVPNMSTNIRGH